ncbi:hypothetical protein SESBI_31686 [Sesbania bispinosa]|nr:hypothetical protein SESBI_31686 [Sesbania bispinosa]
MSNKEVGDEDEVILLKRSLRRRRTRREEEIRGTVTTIAGGFIGGGATSSARRRYYRSVMQIAAIPKNEPEHPHYPPLTFSDGDWAEVIVDPPQKVFFEQLDPRGDLREDRRPQSLEELKYVQIGVVEGKCTRIGSSLQEELSA